MGGGVRSPIRRNRGLAFNIVGFTTALEGTTGSEHKEASHP